MKINKIISERDIIEHLKNREKNNYVHITPDVNIILSAYSNHRLPDVEERTAMCSLLVERFTLKRDLSRVIRFGLNLPLSKSSVIESDMGLCLLMPISLLALTRNWYVAPGVRSSMNAVFPATNGTAGIHMVTPVSLNSTA